MENESVCYPEAQSSLSLGCTPFWNYEETARSSCDNHSSILWEVPPARNTGPAGLDIAFEVLLQTDVIKSHSPGRKASWRVGEEKWGGTGELEHAGDAPTEPGTRCGREGGAPASPARP